MDRILLGHGSGGRMMHDLISGMFESAFGNVGTADAAVLAIPPGRIAFSTDSYVVSPLFFPGGDIGDLAVNGTVNDISMMGAKPLYMSVGFIIEEGLPMEDLGRVVGSMARAASEAGIRIVTGDTKVVDRGHGDGLFINTSGIGVVPDGVTLSPANMRPGDRVLISGPIGRHGVAVMGERNGITFEPPVLSDTAPLSGLAAMLIEHGEGLRVMRDPTRGGVATTLKELALESGMCVTLDEGALPVPGGVRGACDLLGLDPLYVANEGILVAVLSPDVSEYALNRLREHPLGRGAAIIGAVSEKPGRTVLLSTAIGGGRMVDMLSGGQLPRIC